MAVSNGMYVVAAELVICDKENSVRLHSARKFWHAVQYICVILT